MIREAVDVGSTRARVTDALITWLAPVLEAGEQPSNDTAHQAFAELFDRRRGYGISWSVQNVGKAVGGETIGRVDDALEFLLSRPDAVEQIARRRQRNAGRSSFHYTISDEVRDLQHDINDARVDLIDASLRLDSGRGVSDDELIRHGERAKEVRIRDNRGQALTLAAGVAMARFDTTLDPVEGDPAHMGGLALHALDWWLEADDRHRWPASDEVLTNAVEAFEAAMTFEPHFAHILGSTDRMDLLRGLGDELARRLDLALLDSRYDDRLLDLAAVHLKQLAIISPKAAAEAAEKGALLRNAQRSEVAVSVIMSCAPANEPDEFHMPREIELLVETVSAANPAFANEAPALWNLRCRAEVQRPDTPPLSHLLAQLRFDLRDQLAPNELESLIADIADLTGLDTSQMHRVGFLRLAQSGDLDGATTLVRNHRSIESSTWIFERKCAGRLLILCGTPRSKPYGSRTMNGC
jgi:hypothetical protein